MSYKARLAIFGPKHVAQRANILLSQVLTNTPQVHPALSNICNGLPKLVRQGAKHYLT